MTSSSQRLQVRALRAADAAIYQKIRLFGLKESPTAFGSSYEETKNLPLEVHARRLGSDHAKEVVMGVFADKELVGIGSLLRCERMKEAHKAWIVGIYVLPEFRGQGVARKVMQKLMEKAKSMKGLRRVNLTATASNAAAKRLYDSLGFKTYGLEPKAICVDGEFFGWEHMGIELKRKKKARLRRLKSRPTG